MLSIGNKVMVEFVDRDDEELLDEDEFVFEEFVFGLEAGAT